MKTADQRGTVDGSLVTAARDSPSRLEAFISTGLGKKLLLGLHSRKLKTEALPGLGNPKRRAAEGGRRAAERGRRAAEGRVA